MNCPKREVAVLFFGDFFVVAFVVDVVGESSSTKSNADGSVAFHFRPAVSQPSPVYILSILCSE